MGYIAYSQWSIEYVCEPECSCLICRLLAPEDAQALLDDYMERCEWPLMRRMLKS